MTTLKRTRETQFYFCLAIISTIILIWLISPLFYPDVWKGYYQQEDPDSLLFTRQLEQSLLKGRVLTTDNYAAFPYETKTGFAPFYMWFLFCFVNLVFYLFPNLSVDPIYVASILPIIIPWLTSILLLLAIYKLSKNKILTLFCALGMLPGFSAAMTAGFMKLDYDFIISFFIWSWVIFGAFYIKTEKHGYVYVGSAITALFISTWTGAPFFYFFACIYGLILWLFNTKANKAFLTYSSITMLIGSIIAIIFVPRTEDTLRYFLSGEVARYSYIHCLMVFLGALFLLIINKLSSTPVTRYKGIIITLLFALILMGVFHKTIFQSTGILFQKDPIHATIGELLTAFNLKNIFKDTIIDILYRFTPLLLLLPICYLIEIKKCNSKEQMFILHWLLIFIILAVFYQIRYIRWIGCGYGVLIGFVCFYLWETLDIMIKNSKFSSLRKMIILFPLITATITINYSIISNSSKFSKERVELYSWIRNFTPPTSGYSDEGKPEYGILAYWDQGNKISFYTKRPVYASNSMWGYKTMADVFSSEKETDSFTLCNKYRVRYIVFDPSREIDKLALSYWPMLKDTPETPEYKLFHGEVTLKESFNYFYFWLTQHLGLTPFGDFSTTEHFRIVFANMNDGNTISKYIMFETVKGSNFYLSIEPNSKVSISLEFKLGEMSFIYKVNRTSDEKGICQFILPYSNSYNCGNIITDPFYKVSIEKNGIKRLAKLVISDSDVVEGKKVDLSKQFEFVGE